MLRTLSTKSTPAAVTSPGGIVHYKWQWAAEITNKGNTISCTLLLVIYNILISCIIFGKF
jgi:hypothetical protein